MSRSSKNGESSAPVIANNDGWDDASTKKLLEQMQGMLPKPDAIKYKTTLEKFKWDSLKIDNFGPEQCKKQWSLIYKKLRKYRTLSDLIGESLELLEDPYKGIAKKHPDHPKRPLTPYFRFFLEQRRIYAETHKELSNIEITTILSQKYRDISPDIKQKYIEDWKKEMVEYRKKIVAFKKNHPEYYDTPPPNTPRSAVQIYKDMTSSKKKGKENSSKSPYHDLPDSEKLPYILQAVEEFSIYQKEIAAYKQTHPNFKPTEKKSVLSKEDWKIHDKSLGKPDRPPANGYNLFCSRLMVSDELKNYSSRERIMQCGKMWQEIDEEEKKKYNQEYLKIRDEYRVNLNKFLQSLTPAVREAYLARKQSESSSGRVRRSDLDSSALKYIKKEESEISDSSSDDDETIVMNDTSDGSDSSESSDEEEAPPPKKIRSPPPKLASPPSRQTKKRRKSSVNVTPKVKSPEKKPPTDATQPTKRPFKPISAVFIYQRRNRAMYHAMFPNKSSSEITMLMARRFYNLPLQEKIHYKRAEETERRKIREEMAESLEKGEGELTAVTGEQIYHEQNRKLYLQKPDCNESNVEAIMRRAWSRMNKDRREKYIQIAHRINQKNIAEHTTATLGGSQKSSFDMNGDITPKMMETLKLLQPVKPPEEGFALFINENKHRVSHIVPDQRAKELSNLWNGKSETIRSRYESTAEAMMEKYKRKHEKWLKTLPRELLDRYKKTGTILPEKNKNRKRHFPRQRGLYSDAEDWSSNDFEYSSSDEGSVIESGFEENMSDESADTSSAAESSSSDSETDSDDSSSHE